MVARRIKQKSRSFRKLVRFRNKRIMGKPHPMLMESGLFYEGTIEGWRGKTPLFICDGDDAFFGQVHVKISGIDRARRNSMLKRFVQVDRRYKGRVCR